MYFQVRYVRIIILSYLVSMSRETSFLLFIRELSLPNHIAPSLLGSINMGGLCHDEHSSAAFSIWRGPKSVKSKKRKELLSLHWLKSIWFKVNGFRNKNLQTSADLDQSRKQKGPILLTLVNRTSVFKLIRKHCQFI